MFSIDMYYTVCLGRGDGSDSIDYTIELTDEEYSEFKETIKIKMKKTM